MRKFFGLIAILLFLSSCDFQYKYKNIDDDSKTEKVTTYTSIQITSTSNVVINITNIGIFTTPAIINIEDGKTFNVCFQYTKTITTVTVEDDYCHFHGHSFWKWHKHKGNHPCKGHCVKCRPNVVYDENTETTVTVTVINVIKTIQFDTTMINKTIVIGVDENGKDITITISKNIEK